MSYVKRELIESTAEKVGLDIAKRMEDAVMKGNQTVVFVIAFIIAGLSDLNVIASVPIVGWFFDILTVVVLYMLLTSFNSFIGTKVKIIRAILYFFEFIPAIDVLPFWITAVFITWIRVKKASRDGLEGLEKIHRTGEVDQEKIRQFSK